MEKAGVASPGSTGWSFHRSQGQRPALLRGVVDGRQHGRTLGCNSGIGASGTPW